MKDICSDDRHRAVRCPEVDAGGWIGGRGILISPLAVVAVDLAGSEVSGSPTHQRCHHSWLASKLMDCLAAIQSMGLPLATGLLVLSFMVSGTAYLLIRTVWSSRTRYQWRSRRAARTSSRHSC